MNLGLRNHKNPENNIFHLNISIIVKHVNHIFQWDQGLIIRRMSALKAQITDASADGLAIPSLGDKE